MSSTGYGSDLYFQKYGSWKALMAVIWIIWIFEYSCWYSIQKRSFLLFKLNCTSLHTAAEAKHAEMHEITWENTLNEMLTGKNAQCRMQVWMHDMFDEQSQTWWYLSWCFLMATLEPGVWSCVFGVGVFWKWGGVEGIYCMIYFLLGIYDSVISLRQHLIGDLLLAL